MNDVVDPGTRSKMMRGIKSKNSKPEVNLRTALHLLGFRFRIHRKDLPGRPDIVFPMYRAVVFVHGCFWHRHGCHLTATPKSNSAFWEAKFRANVLRDARQFRALVEGGWRVAVIWECELRKAGAGVVAERLGRWLTSDSVYVHIPA